MLIGGKVDMPFSLSEVLLEGRVFIYYIYYSKKVKDIFCYSKHQEISTIIYWLVLLKGYLVCGNTIISLLPERKAGKRLRN